MNLQPISLREARQYIAENHRHSRAPQGWLFGVAAVDGGRIAGVGVAGRPVARMLQDGFTVEITRVCTDGSRNVCSLLYGALCRAAKALGYRCVITYTLATEPGSSVLASGFTRSGMVAADVWDRPARPRRTIDLFGEPITPVGAKQRWERIL